jgi:single-strand DNA-binding protein
MNKLILMGRLGQDPEVKDLGAGNTVTNFSVATSRKYFSKKEDKQVEEVQWHSCSAFGKNGENIAKWLSKGKQILIEGTVKYRPYEKEGVKAKATNVLVDRFEFVGQSGDSGEAKDAESSTSAGALSQPEPKFDANEEVPF